MRELLMTTIMSGVESGWLFDGGDGGGSVVVKCGEVEGGEWMVAAEFGGR